MSKKYIERYWRDAKPEDAIKESPMVARFWSRGDVNKTQDRLYGIDRSSEDYKWKGQDVDSEFCEVYDAPDPGEGYELIDTENDSPKVGDEYFVQSSRKWFLRDAELEPFDPDFSYRRKIVAEAKAETVEPVTFVAHPIQFNDKLEYCFKGKPIQFRSYAVLNEQGHYLQHLPAYPPQYAPEFRQTFTPLQLLQLSVRELGSNIRLRAVEPVDVDKLKQEYMQELKKKLQPKVPEREAKREKVMWQGREYYVLTRFRTLTDHGHSPNVRVVLQDANVLESYVAMAFADDLEKIPGEPQPEATQPVKEPKYVPFEWEDREQLRGRVIAFTERNRKVEFRCEHFQHDSDGLLVNEFYAPWLCKNAVFTDTKEPVGKRVED